MTTHTLRFHRVLRCPPVRIYQAFTNAAAFCKWLPPFGFTATMHTMEVRVGGRWRMSFTNHTTGNAHSFGGEYLELTPNRRVRYTAVFDDPNLPGTTTTTVDLREFACGTEVEITQEGVPSVIPAAACCLGWQESLVQLAQLAEPEIPE